MKNPCCLIIDLGNGDSGFVKYSTSILGHFSNVEAICFQSKHRGIKSSLLPEQIFFVNSYTNAKDILFKTLFILPCWLVFSIVLLLSGKVDRVYFPYFNHWNIFFALLFKIFRKPIIYTAHDGKMHFGEKSAYTQYVLYKLIELSTDVIFLSNAVKGEVKQHIKHQRCRIIPHGIFAIEGIKELQMFGPLPRLLFVGRISPYKGVEMLVEAVNQLEDHIYDKLVIAGKSNYAIKINQGRKVELIDKWLSEPEIADFINDSDIIIFPYLEATQSGAITLAISGLRPIIYTKVGGMPEQVSSEEALAVEPNVEALREGIRALANDIERRKKMSLSLKEKKQKRSWENIAQEIQSVLKEAHQIYYVSTL